MSFGSAAGCSPIHATSTTTRWHRSPRREIKSSRSTASISPTRRAAARLFTLYNLIKERRARLIATSRAPLATLPLREDVRTRLGWGLVYELLSLEDDAKPAALAVYAKSRGIALSQEVIDYLLRHGRRDMPSLLATLAALDRVSLATKRPITVPLLKGWLQRELEWKPAAPDASRSA